MVYGGGFIWNHIHVKHCLCRCWLLHTLAWSLCAQIHPPEWHSIKQLCLMCRRTSSKSSRHFCKSSCLPFSTLTRAMENKYLEWVGVCLNWDKSTLRWQPISRLLDTEEVVIGFSVRPQHFFGNAAAVKYRRQILLHHFVPSSLLALFSHSSHVYSQQACSIPPAHPPTHQLTHTQCVAEGGL